MAMSALLLPSGLPCLGGIVKRGERWDSEIQRTPAVCHLPTHSPLARRWNCSRAQTRSSITSLVGGAHSETTALHAPFLSQGFLPKLHGIPKKLHRTGKHKTLVQASASPTEGEPLTKSGFAADKGLQERTYALLAAISAASAIASLAYPEQTLGAVLHAQTNPLAISSVKAAGASLLPIAASHWCLKDAAHHDRLTSATYKRLNLAVILFWAIVLWIVVAARFQTLLVGAPFWILTVVSVVGAGLPWAIAHSTGSTLVALYKEFSSAYGTVLKFEGPTSFAYGFFSCACYALGSGLFYFPRRFELPYAKLLGASPAVPDFWWQHLANVYYAASVLFFVLKDASERGRLGASTFKNINVSFAAASLAIVVNFVSDFLRMGYRIQDVGIGWSFHVVVLALVFVVTAYHYLTARK